MHTRSMFTSASLGLLGASLLSLAAPAAEPQQTFKALIGQGLKIVSVSVVPAEVNKTANPVVIVTLQLDRTVAVCTFGVGTWENMTAANVEQDAKACDVRTY